MFIIVLCFKPCFVTSLGFCIYSSQFDPGGAILATPSKFPSQNHMKVQYIWSLHLSMLIYINFGIYYALNNMLYRSYHYNHETNHKQNSNNMLHRSYHYNHETNHKQYWKKSVSSSKLKRDKKYKIKMNQSRHLLV